jgi:hypothetical protein
MATGGHELDCERENRSRCYNRAMDLDPNGASDSLHDETLIDWFLSLKPIERLAELESRLEFFNAVHRGADAKLFTDPTAA